MARAPSGFSEPGSAAYTDPGSTVLSLTATAEYLGLPPGILFQQVANFFPAWSVDEVNDSIALAHAQKAAGRSFGSPEAYRRPSLAEIPICPGCPKNKIEARLRVRFFDMQGNAIRDRSNQGLEGVVSCVESHIHTLEDLEQCATLWADLLVQGFYSQLPGYQVTWEVESAQRGAFFGR